MFRCFIYLLTGIVFFRFCSAVQATTYTVGPNQPRTRLAEVPWTALQPRDIVRIIGRSEPYREKVLIATSHIRVEGVPGPAGEPVVIDGEGARTPVSFDYPGGTRYLEPLALVYVGRRASQPEGFSPEGVVIAGLTLRNAYSAYFYFNSKGEQQRWESGSTGLYIRAGGQLTVRHCRFVGNGVGLFTKPVTRGIAVQDCTFEGNGHVGSHFEHHLYVEATAARYERLRFGPLRPGAKGACLKDRSGTVVVTGCTFAPGPATQRHLDLVDPQDGAAVITQVPHFGQVRVESCRFYVEGGGSPIHYGGDSDDTRAYRKKTLTLCANQFVVQGATTVLLKLASNEQEVALQGGNRFWVGATTPFYLGQRFGQIRVEGVNTFHGTGKAFAYRDRWGWWPFAGNGGRVIGVFYRETHPTPSVDRL